MYRSMLRTFIWRCAVETSVYFCVSHHFSSPFVYEILCLWDTPYNLEELVLCDPEGPWKYCNIEGTHCDCLEYWLWWIKDFRAYIENSAASRVPPICGSPVIGEHWDRCQGWWCLPSTGLMSISCPHWEAVQFWRLLANGRMRQSLRSKRM